MAAKSSYRPSTAPSVFSVPPPSAHIYRDGPTTPSGAVSVTSTKPVEHCEQEYIVYYTQNKDWESLKKLIEKDYKIDSLFAFHDVRWIEENPKNYSWFESRGIKGTPTIYVQKNGKIYVGENAFIFVCKLGKEMIERMSRAITAPATQNMGMGMGTGGAGGSGANNSNSNMASSRPSTPSTPSGAAGTLRTMSTAGAGAGSGAGMSDSTSAGDGRVITPWQAINAKIDDLKKQLSEKIVEDAMFQAKMIAFMSKFGSLQSAIHTRSAGGSGGDMPREISSAAEQWHKYETYSPPSSPTGPVRAPRVKVEKGSGTMMAPMIPSREIEQVLSSLTSDKEALERKAKIFEDKRQAELEMIRQYQEKGKDSILLVDDDEVDLSTRRAPTTRYDDAPFARDMHRDPDEFKEPRSRHTGQITF